MYIARSPEIDEVPVEANDRMDIQLMSVQELQANQKVCCQLMEVGVQMLDECGNQPQVNAELI